MDKKILFKRIAATVSAVAVFALSFFSFGMKKEVVSASVNSVGGALNDYNLILSPFANLSFSGYSDYELMTAYYSIRFDFPKTITSYFDSNHPYGGTYSGNQINIYDYERREYMYTFFDYISPQQRALLFNYSASTSSNFVISGSSFFIPQRYFDLLFSTDFSNISSHGLSFWLTNNEIVNTYSGTFVCKMKVKDYKGDSYDLFGENGEAFYFLNSTVPYRLSQAYSFSDDVLFSSYLASLGYLSDTFNFYSDDDVYYFIEEFSFEFSFGALGPYTFWLGLSNDVGDTYNLINNNAVYLSSYKSVNNLNTISPAYFEESLDGLYEQGYDVGYNYGYAEGSSLAQGDFDLFGTIINAVDGFLEFEILPNFSLGTIFLITFGLGFMFFVMKAFLGG